MYWSRTKSTAFVDIYGSLTREREERTTLIMPFGIAAEKSANNSLGEFPPTLPRLRKERSDLKAAAIERSKQRQVDGDYFLAKKQSNARNYVRFCGKHRT